MKSPFPGMDPYLEQRWADIHATLIVYARNQLNPQLPNDLEARIEETLSVEELGEFMRTITPDVRVTDESLAEDLLAHIRPIASKKRFDLISAAVLEDHLHMFGALRPDQSPRDLALAVMNNTWHWIWKWNPGALKVWDAPDFWTHSAFVRTAGAVTTNQVRAHLRDGSVLRDDG